MENGWKSLDFKGKPKGIPSVNSGSIPVGVSRGKRMIAGFVGYCGVKMPVSGPGSKD
jgi:hypothetical protein